MEQIRKQFMDLDYNCSGYLEYEEIKSLFTNFSRENKLPKPKQWHVQHIISQIDENGDGKLELEELQLNYRYIMKEMVTLHKIVNIWDNSDDSDITQIFFGKMEENMRIMKNKRIAKNIIKNGIQENLVEEEKDEKENK